MDGFWDIFISKRPRDVRLLGDQVPGCSLHRLARFPLSGEADHRGVWSGRGRPTAGGEEPRDAGEGLEWAFKRSNGAHQKGQNRTRKVKKDIQQVARAALTSRHCRKS